MNLRDFYLGILVHKHDRKFLQFTWQNEVFHFTTLEFGLPATPRAFTKISKPDISRFRSVGIRLIIYRDDMFMINQSKIGNRSDFLRAIRISLRCGFLIKEEKSRGDLNQRIEYLGLLINSCSLSLYLRREKANQIISLYKDSLSASKVTLRDLARLLGNFPWASQIVSLAHAHYRSLQSLYIKKSAAADAGLRERVILDVEARKDLAWWLNTMKKLKGKPIVASQPGVLIFCDVSLSGWGATHNGVLSRSPWNLRDQSKHINEL